MIILNERGTPQLNTVHHCRAEALLSALDSASIDLIVTSPPYDNLRRYNGFSWNFEYIAQQSYRVLKPGGVLVWVVGDATIDGNETLTSFKQALYFKECVGFRLHDTMIWHKDGSPSPQSNRYLQTFEYMLILTKGAPVYFDLATQKTRYSASVSTTFRSDGSNRTGFKYALGRETRVMDNVWYIPSGYMKTTLDREAYEHPAMFPEKLVQRHILTWSRAGDIVLDYFGGSGTTAKMARQNNRQWLTCDISREYCDLMEKRLALPYTLNMFSQEAS